VGGDHYFGEHDDSRPEAFLWHEVDQEELEALKKEDRRRIKTEQALQQGGRGAPTIPVPFLHPSRLHSPSPCSVTL